MGIVYGLISLIFIPFFLLGTLASAFAPAQHHAMPQGLSVGLGLVFCIFFPRSLRRHGLSDGEMLMAWLYNVVASWVGGIEFEAE